MITEIYNHCIKDDRYGFTIPYLYKIEKDTNRKKTIKQIIEFFTMAEKKYFISYCDDLSEYIIGLPKREKAPIEMYKSFGNLYYDDCSLGEFGKLEDLIEFLIAEYQIRIDNKTYSKNIETKIWE
jgi:hypothetical protein